MDQSGIMRFVRLFLTGPLAGIVIVAGLIAGLIAILATPREEDPQIIVPMADIEVAYPGHAPDETEQFVTRPLERLLWQLDGVEHVYSISQRDGAVVTVRFHVGEDRDRAMVKLRDKIEENRHVVPVGVSAWRVKPVSINDVPIVTLTIWSTLYPPAELRRIAEELAAHLDAIADISRSEIIGGYPRVIKIEPLVANMRALAICLPDIANAVQRANYSATVGTVTRNGHEQLVLSAPVPRSADDVAKIVISANDSRIVRVADVATVSDAVEVPEAYVCYNGKPAVTIAFSKKAGVNAVVFARDIIQAAKAAQTDILPPNMQLVVTRDHGQSANERVNGLISGMFFAVITVILLIALTMGWRESIVVGTAVPVSFALALFTNYLFGYTLNRVTLFALILSLGLVVDDPITNVDNIQRHIRMGRKSPLEATLDAVREVLPPVIMSTIAIIVSFLPMFFITGMMGPYMGPMAINVPLTVSFSTLCALTFVPFLAKKLLEKHAPAQASLNPATADATDSAPPWIRRLYGWLIRPFLRRRNAWLLVAAVIAALAGASAIMILKVPLKMLPYDNRDELQLVIRTPTGTSDEHTARLVMELEQLLERQNEVVDIQSYVGTASPIDFNGLVRHYGMRQLSHHADIRVNLLPKKSRNMSSHDLALRIRDEVTAIANRHNAMVSIVEIPPGPPVLATITAEVYAEPGRSYDELIAGAQALQDRLRQTDSRHITDIDMLNEPLPERLIFRIDNDKAALNGISVQDVTGCLAAAISGAHLGDLRLPHERQPLHIRLRLPYADRNNLARLGELTIKGHHGNAVPLAEIGSFTTEPPEIQIMHKNLRPVAFVTAEAVGRPPSELVLETQLRTLKDAPLPDGISVKWAGEGEWEVTLRVFRDLGIAFAVALGGILLLLIVQTNSIKLSLVMMSAIPLTIIGIAPGFWLLNAIAAKNIGGYQSPVFFTATGMIGMIALGGIVIRNAIVLIEFIQADEARGIPLQQAIPAAGAVRFRPIMLTAITTLMGAWPITLDPIFSGLAWALIFGLLASTVFTMIVVPAIYFLIAEPQEAAP